MARQRQQVLGLQFGEWIVTNVEINQKDKRHRRVECTCTCGNIAEVRVDNLFKGGSLNCGCKRTEDLTGQRFHKLVVQESLGTNDRGHQVLRCLCDCGKTTTTTFDNLKRAKTKSCGCICSYANELIDTWLAENGYKFEREYKFKDCKRTKPLPFDFAVFLPNIRLIEFQGKHHYETTKGWGGNARLQRTQDSDKIKRDYCLECKIPLLCVPYWEMRNMFERIEAFLE